MNERRQARADLEITIGITKSLQVTTFKVYGIAEVIAVR